MALQKVSRSLLNTGVADSSDATAITIDSSENVTFAGDVTTAYTIQGGAYKIGGTVVINSSRNLTNIGTISSGAITSTGVITGAQDFKATGSNMKLHAGGNHIINIDLNGNFYPQTHNAADLGFSDSLAFRNLHLVGAITGGASISSGAITSTNSSGLGIQTSGYSLLSAANNARAASGSIRLGNGAGSTGLVIDYTDQGQTVATIRNTYVASTDSELTIQSPFITFDTGTSYTERMRIDSSGIVGIGNTVAGTIHGVSTVSNLVVGTGSGNNGIGIYSGSSNLGAIVFGDGTVGNTTYRGGVTYNHSTDHLELNVNGGSAHVKVHSSGVTSIPYGVELGSGLDATAANTLDDYEEGTFDASITPASGSYTLNSAYSKFGYTKVGRVVTITGMVVISAASGASGSVTIGDLPFEMLNATERSSQTRPSIHIYANGSGAPASGYYPAFIAFNEGNRSGSLIITYNNTHDTTVGDWFTGGSDIFLNFSYHAA